MSGGTRQRLTDPVEIAPRVWWVSEVLDGVEFQCHVYLIEQGEQSVIIDPGSALVAGAVLENVEEVVGLRNVRWLVCSTAEADVVGSLSALEAAGLHPEVHIVTSWHNQLSLTSTGLTLPVRLAESEDARLVLQDRTLRFIWLPYVPSVGAFASFDEASGTLFSSSLFGGQSSGESLVADSLDYYKAIKPYHQHYVPGRDVLSHALRQVRGLPVRLVAPHRGQLVRGELFEGLVARLERLEVGLATLRGIDDNLRFVLGANRIISRVADALVHEQSFADVVAYLEELARRTTGAIGLELWAGTPGALLRFDASDGFAGRLEEPPGAVRAVLAGETPESGEWVMVPILTPEISRIEGVVILRYPQPVELDPAILDVVRQLIGLVGVGLEREVLRRSTHLEMENWRERAVLDTLTGLRNRASLIEAARSMLEGDDLGAEPHVAALMIDIDYFKVVNDTYGHVIGDRVLTSVAQAIVDSVRPSDFVFRYGGEEFLVLMSAVDETTARRAAERIRARVAVAVEDGLAVSVSVGVAHRSPGEGVEALVERADRALYVAKENGRDRVEVL